MTHFEPGPAVALPHELHRPQSVDIINTLPPLAGERLQHLRQRVEDLRALTVPFAQRHEVSTAKIEAAQRLRRLQDHGSAGGFALKPSDVRVVQAEREYERLAAEHERLTRLDAERSATWQKAGNLLASVENWLRSAGRPGGTTLADFEGPKPKLLRDESVIDAIARIRQRGAELRADLRNIRTAPHMSAHVRAKVRAEIEALAARAPSVSDIVAHDGQIVWPMQRVQAQVLNVETPAVAFCEVPDVLAIVCFAHRAALLSAFDAQVDESNDKVALTPDTRARSEAAALSSILACDRDEAALMFRGWADGANIEPRADLDPMATLNVELVTLHASGDSDLYSYDVVGGR